MAVHKDFRAPQKSNLGTGKENMPPSKKARRTISVSTLFGQKHDLRRKAAKGVQDMLGPKSAGVSKLYASNRTGKTAKQHPLYRRFLGATKHYRKGPGGGKGAQLETVYTELVAKVNTLDVNGTKPGPEDSASGNGVTALAAEHIRLSIPLGEDKIEIQRTRADGSTVAQECKLSGTMQAFERLHEQKRGELDHLLRELKDVDAEIAAVKQDIVRVEQKEGKKLKTELDARVAALVKEADTCKEAMLREVEKARKDDRKATAAQNEAFEKFLQTI